jgi:acetyl-CoA acetyltransferase
MAAIVMRCSSHRSIDQTERYVSRLAALQAHEQVRRGPRDIQVAEMHDASAMGESIQVENVGVVSPGEGGPASEGCEFALGGRLPVNQSGGLESKGRALDAFGLGEFCELTTQLRGEAGTRHAMQEDGGGSQGIEEAAVAIHILGKRCIWRQNRGEVR